MLLSAIVALLRAGSNALANRLLSCRVDRNTRQLTQRFADSEATPRRGPSWRAWIVAPLYSGSNRRIRSELSPVKNTAGRDRGVAERLEGSAVLSAFLAAGRPAGRGGRCSASGRGRPPDVPRSPGGRRRGTADRAARRLRVQRRGWSGRRTPLSLIAEAEPIQPVQRHAADRVVRHCR